MSHIIGCHTVHQIQLKAGEPATIVQVAAPERDPIKFHRFTVGFPDYGFVDGPVLAHVGYSLERQKGGTFANAGMVPDRVSGADRPNEQLRARYRNVVRAEPEATEVLESGEFDVHSGEVIEIAGKAPIDVAPGEAIGLRLTSSHEVRVHYVYGEHDE